MSMKLNQSAFEQLIAEDIAWLEKQPRMLEQEHIIMCVREAVRYYYVDAQDEAITNARLNALRPPEKHEMDRIYLEMRTHPNDRDALRIVINELLEMRQGHP